VFRIPTNGGGPGPRSHAVTLALALTFAAVALAPIHAAGATPLIKMSLSVSPNPAAWTVPVTYTGVITPVSGVPTGVRVDMEGTGFHAINCGPAAFCTMSVGGHPQWDFPQITGKTIVTATSVELTDQPVRFFLLLGNVGCADSSCPGVATLRHPTPKVSISYTTAGIVLPGSILHFTMTATTNAGPDVGANLHANLPAGLEEPTNLAPATAMWNPSPYFYIDDHTDFTTTATLTFDSRVNAPIGTSLKVTSYLYQAYPWNGTATAAVTIHVGATPTPAPKPAPGPTARPKSSAAAPTRSPSASVTAALTATPTATASATPTASVSSANPTTAAPSRSAGTNDVATDPSSTSPPSLPIIAGGALLVSGAMALVILTRRRRGA
jgi:hypothetical protein